MRCYRERGLGLCFLRMFCKYLVRFNVHIPRNSAVLHLNANATGILARDHEGTQAAVLTAAFFSAASW